MNVVGTTLSLDPLAQPGARSRDWSRSGGQLLEQTTVMGGEFGLTLFVVIARSASWLARCLGSTSTAVRSQRSPSSRIPWRRKMPAVS